MIINRTMHNLSSMHCCTEKRPAQLRNCRIVKLKNYFYRMNAKRLLLLSLFSLVAIGTALATAKTKKKTNIKLVTAYSKTISEEEQSNPQMQGTFIVIKWDHTTYPETMFWRGQNGWFTCQIDKAHKVVKNKKTDYTTEAVQIDQVKKGDTLFITPLKGGRFPIPAEIPEKAKNTLFYKTAGNPAWQSFVVSPIAKK